MRDCEAFMEQISALLDEELGEYETDVLMAHLNTCPECRIFYDAFIGISDNLQTYATTAPEGLSRSVMRSIEENCAPRKRKSPLRLLGRAASIAACFALLILTVSLFRGGDISGGNSGTGSLSAAPADVSESGTSAQDPSADGGALDTVLGADIYTGSEEAPPSPEGENVNEEAVQDSRHNVAMMGELRPLDAFEAREFVDSIASIRKAVFYLPGDMKTPVLTIDDSETISSLAELLKWSEKPEEFDVTFTPTMAIEATPDQGNKFLITLWVYEGKIYCGTDIDGESARIYVAGGSLDDLLAFIS